jgi:hypothetical protein
VPESTAEFIAIGKMKKQTEKEKHQQPEQQ